MASGGYPDRYATGFEIRGLYPGGPEYTTVFHAGTEAGSGGGAVTVGGRVLTVVGGGESLPEARERAYRRLDGISFEGAEWRTDIGAENTGSQAEWRGLTTAAG
jgi:phosphoribosylamine--glycine ligase